MFPCYMYMMTFQHQRLAYMIGAYNLKRAADITQAHTHTYSYIKELEKVEEQKKKKGLRRVEAKIK